MATSIPVEADFADLLGRCERGEATAVAVVYRHYQPMLVRYATRRGAADPEGVADLALFDALRAIGGLRGRNEGAFRAYAFGCTRNRVASELRRPAVATQPLIEDDRQGWGDDDPAEQVVGHQEVQDLLSQLTEAQRQVLDDRLFRGHTSAETAARMGKTPGAVRKLQHDALQRLRRILLVAVLAAVVAGVVLVMRTQSDETPLETVDDGPVPEVTTTGPSPVPTDSTVAPSPSSIPAPGAPTTSPAVTSTSPPTTDAATSTTGPSAGSPTSVGAGPEPTETESALGPAPVIRSCEIDDGVEVQIGSGVAAESFRYLDRDLNPIAAGGSGVRYVVAVAADGAESEPFPCSDD